MNENLEKVGLCYHLLLEAVQDFYDVDRARAAELVKILTKVEMDANKS